MCSLSRAATYGYFRVAVRETTKARDPHTKTLHLIQAAPTLNKNDARHSIASGRFFNSIK